MKKVLLLTVLTVGLMSVALAQENYKPRSGDFSLEVGFAPFGQNIINSGNLAGYFHFSNSVAFRLGVELGFASEMGKNGKSGKDKVKESYSAFSISVEPGIVYYFKGTPRLAPYFGGGIGLGYSSNFHKYKTNDKTEKERNIGESDSFDFDLGITTGFNYFFAKNLYVGAEVGFGLGVSHYLTYWSNDDDFEKSKERYNDLAVNLYAQPLLRLGWTF